VVSWNGDQIAQAALADEGIATEFIRALDGRENVRRIDLRRRQFPGVVDAAVPVSVKEELTGTEVHHQ
jgi:hypothetical protein